MPEPQKAYFQRVNSPNIPAVCVKFNPTEFTLTKNAQIAEIPIPGLDSPILQFVRGQTETLSLDLFFDTTDSGTGANVAPVTDLTDQFYNLIKIESDTHAPPVLLFSWGGRNFPGHSAQSHPSAPTQGQQGLGAQPSPGGQSGRVALGTQQRYGFTCIVDSVRQRYTLFSPDGTPLRATLTVSLREYKTLADQVHQLNLQSADQTRARVVVQGDTLARLAFEAYGDPGQWRRIADANQLFDPLALIPGAVLQIPPAS